PLLPTLAPPGPRSRRPPRRPRPLRFERLRVPVWNPDRRGRLSPAKSEDRKGGEGKTDANLTFFFSTCCAYSTLALGAFRIARGAGGEGVDVNGNLVEREKGDEFGIETAASSSTLSCGQQEVKDG